MFNQLTPYKQKPLIAKGLDCDDKIRRFFPLRYNDYSHITKLSGLFIPEKGLNIAVVGIVERINAKEKNGKRITLVNCREKDSGTKFLATFIGIYNIENQMAGLAQKPLLFMGVFKHTPEFGYSCINPDFSDDIVGMAKIQPVYRKVKRVAKTTLTTEIHEALKESEIDTIPSDLLTDTIGINEALNKIHCPNNLTDVTIGEKRIHLDDLVYLNISLLNNARPSSTEIVMQNTEETYKMIQGLPYKLTNDQMNTINSMINRAKSGNLINALIQGDVGCGKTIIAFSMMRFAGENNYQSVLMAPTQILASQHYNAFIQLVPENEVAYFDHSINNKKKQKRELLAKINSGEIKYIIGTHALLSANIEYNNIGLAIVDEEHRFGVEQRAKLLDKGIHTFIMSATPIPRSYAKAVYGDETEVYQIIEKPEGRKPVITYYDNGSKVKNFIYSQLKQGMQAYIVCPLIEEAEEGSRMEGILSVDEVYKEYKSQFEQIGFKVACVTGDTKAKDKDEIIGAFSNGDINILISTTVIEVGVNVPNANVMVIINAERFGLATLHQLRGRVGRGDKQAYCILVSPEKNERIKIMGSTTDGFKIAEADLMERKAGNFLGIEQSGKNILVDTMLSYPQLNEQAKNIAKIMIERGVQDMHIQKYDKIYENM